MYLHIGSNKMIRQKDIIGIFDMDNAGSGGDTMKLLRRLQKEGRFEFSNTELPKSFVLYEKDDGKDAICTSQLATSALVRRARKGNKK